MLKNLNYICFDFETTWLDINKDEPIQLGMVRFDKDFNVLNSIEEYIKPSSKKDIKNIVNYITWINFQDIEDARSVTQVVEDLSCFLNENTVFIGHNVNFDKQILQKYVDFTPYQEVDTFWLSKSIFHFLPSYSLEIISEILKKEGKVSSDVVAYHNAYFDSIACMQIFKEFVDYSYQLFEKYPNLPYFINKSNSVYSKIFDLSLFNKTIKKGFFLPSLKKEIKDKSRIYKKDSYDLLSFENKQKLYLWNIDKKEFVSKLSGANQKIILAFATPSKLKIFKNLFQQVWVKNIGYLSESIILNQDNIEAFLNKESFEEFEINFLIKYYSQYEKNHGFLDINSYEDWKVYNFLKENIEKKLPDIVLTTHQGLYESLRVEKDLSRHVIFFLDHDRWYQTFSKYINRPFDLYKIPNFLEQVIYQKQIRNEDTKDINDFLNYFLVLIWVVFSEITTKFKNVQKPKIELDAIVDNVEFYKTNKLLSDLKERKDKILPLLSEYERQELEKNLGELDEVFNNVVVAEKVIYDDGKMYYIFHKTYNVINYQEFLYYFEWNHILFGSFINKEKSSLLQKEETKETKSNFLTNCNNYEQIEKIVNKNHKIFILSSNKVYSKEIFENLLENSFHETYSILVENVTWGVGKNIFYAKQDTPKIVIWGVEFLLNLFSEEVDFDKIIVYFIPEQFRNNIKKDIMYYN